MCNFQFALILIAIIFCLDILFLFRKIKFIKTEKRNKFPTDFEKDDYIPYRTRTDKSNPYQRFNNMQPYQIDTRGKNLFLFLSTASLLLMMLLTTLLWWFISPRLHEISKLLASGILTILRAFYLLVIFSIIILFYNCYTRYTVPLFNRIIRFTINFLFPINVFLAKFIGLSKEKVRESFINVNNAFIKTNKLKLKPKEILLLLPHCLQNYDCSYRVTNIIDNCVDCGKCVIMKLKNISKVYNINIAIATGGTLARKIIIQTRPKFIIAVACQKDLVDGLLEVFPIPVLGLLNDRPQGPCINTDVDVSIIEEFLNNTLQKNIINKNSSQQI